MAKFSPATNERYKDKDGQWQDRTEWHNLLAWQRTAEIVGEYMKRGSKVYIEGSLRTSSWDDKSTGEKKYRTEIVVNDLVLLSGRGDGEGVCRGAAARTSISTPPTSPSRKHLQLDISSKERAWIHIYPQLLSRFEHYLLVIPQQTPSYPHFSAQST